MAAIWENIYEPTQTQLLLYLMFTQDSKAVTRENFEGPHEAPNFAIALTRSKSPQRKGRIWPLAGQMPHALQNCC